MDPARREEAVRLILAARGDHRVLDGLPESCRPRTVAEGYAIQDAVVEALGLGRAGFKIGCTSAEAQAMLGTDGPFAGTLLSSVVIDAPAEIPAGAFHLRGLEGEFAFRLGDDLPPRGAPYTPEDMASAVESLHPAIEIVDSRFDNWTTIGVPMLIADNGVSGGLVLGAAVAGWAPDDIPGTAVTMALNGEVRKRGTGGDVLGHPLNALAWLANHRAERADGLKAGEVVTTGTCTSVVFAAPGDRAEADFGPFGRVELVFTA